MKKDDNILKPIYELLDKYYSGLTTPREEEALEDFFLHTDENTLPEELREESKVFKSLHSYGSKGIDNAFLKEIDDAIASEKVAVLRPRRWHLVSVSVAAAAVLAVVVLVGAFFVSVKDSVDVVTPDLIAEASVTDTNEINEDEIIAPAPVVEKNVVQERTASVVKEKYRTVKQTETFSYEEITDSAEVMKYLAYVNNVLDETLASNLEKQSVIASALRKIDDKINIQLSRAQAEV